MCTSPNRVFYTGLRTDTGKELLYFDNHYPSPDKISLDLAEKRLKVRIPLNPEFVKNVHGHMFLVKSVDVPCGHCDECTMKRSKDWAHRILMECKYHLPEECHFITLTFMDPFCPKYVCKDDVSSFMKRLRSATGQEKVKFFASGEYGSASKRPHYHLIVIGLKLDDLYLVDGIRHLYSSKLLERIWPFGMVRIGQVTQESANYVARYTSKKIGDRKGFVLMSRRPGLGYRYIKDHKVFLECDYLPLYYNDSLHRLTPPRYVERVFPDFDFSLFKERRVENARNAYAKNEVIHKVFGCRLDDYLRDLARARASRIMKKEI